MSAPLTVFVNQPPAARGVAQTHIIAQPCGNSRVLFLAHALAC